MDAVATETKYVSGLAGASGDPSPVTALGVFYGIKASVQHKLKRDNLLGLTVAVQGIGSVGRYLCGYLHEAGAKLIVADLDEARAGQMATQYAAKVTGIRDIHATQADVFAPCALGAILNDETIPQLKTTIVAGGANNQLLNEDRHGAALRDRGILYAPDYVINAGGLINVFHELKGYNAEAAKRQASNIFNTMLEVYAIAERDGISTHKASDRLAEQRIKATKEAVSLRNNYNNQPWLNR